MSRFTFNALSTLAICGFASLSFAQTAGMEQGSKPVGMTPAGFNAASVGGGYTNLPEGGTPRGAGLPNAGVPPILRGYTVGYRTTQTRIVQTDTEWQTVYLKLNQPQVPYQAYNAPDVADFTGENLAIILLGQDYGTNCSPTVDSVTWDGYKTTVCYTVWTPLNNNQPSNGNGKGDDRNRGKDGKDGNKDQKSRPGQSSQAPVQQSQAPKGQQGSGNQGQGQKTPNAPGTTSTTSQYTLYPYVVVRYQKHAGATQFVGRVQYFRPYGWGW